MQQITVEDLINMNKPLISAKIASNVLEIDYRGLIRSMSEMEPLPFNYLKRGNRFYVVRASLLHFMTGETYEQQLAHRRRILEEYGLEENADDVDPTILSEIRL